MKLPYSSPKLTEALAAQFRAQAAQFGLVLATRCQHCGAPLWEARSLAERAGPVCRSRQKKNDPSASDLAGTRTGAEETIPTT